jgi:hypothetical protein
MGSPPERPTRSHGEGRDEGREEPMTITLQDPTLQRDPSSRHAFPTIVGEGELRAPRTLAEELLVSFRGGRLASETSFELGSRGGYARTVTGKVAYLDEQAATFMVRGMDGELIRVPLRDVTTAHPEGPNVLDDPPSGRDVDGLGAGPRLVIDTN